MSQRLDDDEIAPAGAKALAGVYGYVMHSGLPARLVDLVYLRVSQMDLTIAIGLMNTYNRMAISFRNTPKAVFAG